MTRKIRITTSKDLDFGILEYKRQQVIDPLTKRSTWEDVPQFEAIRPQKNEKKINGVYQGKPITIWERTYIFTEKKVNEIQYYEPSQDGKDRFVSWEHALKLLFTDKFIKNKLMSRECTIKLFAEDDSDKSTVKWLIDQGLIKDSWISNTEQYVQQKEGVTHKKAMHYLKQAAAEDKSFDPSKVKSENESNPEAIAGSPMLKEFNAAKASGPSSLANVPEGDVGDRDEDFEVPSSQDLDELTNFSLDSLDTTADEKLASQTVGNPKKPVEPATSK